MATLSVIPIEIEAGGSQGTSRPNRRAHVAPELLRSHKLAAGEWTLLRRAAVAKGEPDDKAIGWVVAQLWPRVGLEEDSKKAS